jgi:peptidoglycan/xylan/chitin deacetylase (PgdA/CDA1 family)
LRGFARFITVILTIAILIQTSILGSAAEGSAKVYHKSASGGKKIALTFDDGPHPRYTPKILSILKEYGITATFFVVGVNVEYYPEAMQLIVDSGCEIGNHTYKHKNLSTLTKDEISDEIGRCREVLLNYYSVDSRLLRPPEGMYSEDVLSESRAVEHEIILWSIDTRDWAHTPSAEIAKNVLGNARGGDIILMHDYVSGQNQTIGALRLIIPELLERGFEFVTVSELLEDEF